MPAKKPADRRQGRGTTDLGLVAMPVQLERPDPPDNLLSETVDLWESFWASDEAALVKPSNYPALSRLFAMYDQRARCEAAVRDTSMLVIGSTGQPVANPLLAQIASLDTRILAIEDRFGQNPAARLKLGVSFLQGAKTLEDLNRAFDSRDDEAEEDDPRLRAIDTTAV